MNKYLLLINLLFWGHYLSAQPVLEDYLRQAAENHPELKVKYNRYYQALQKIPQVRALPEPTVAFAYFIQPVETRLGPQRAKISVNQMFPWFGTLKAKENISIQKAKTLYEEFEEAKSKLFYKVRTAYYELYLTNQSIVINTQNIELLQTILTLVKKKNLTGKKSLKDNIQIEISIADMENNLFFLKDLKDFREVKFLELLQEDTPKTIHIPNNIEHSKLHLTIDSLREKMLSDNHQLRQFDFEDKALDFENILVKKASKPTFSIGLDYAFVGKYNNPMLSNLENGKDAIMFPMLMFTIPLHKKKYEAMTKEVFYKKEVVKYKKEATISTLEVLFEKVLLDYKDAERRILHFQKQVLRTKQLLTLQETEYMIGKTDVEDILVTEKKTLLYQLEIQKAITQQLIAMAYINYLIGN